jgi:uncharacterized protein (TIGR02646 family)
MIRIERDLNPPDLPVYTHKRSKALDGTKVTKYEREKELAIAYYSDPDHFQNDEKVTEKKAPTFSVYKDKGLVAALEDVFGKKCAYCESDFGAVTPSDIEHFRPKSAIKTSVDDELKPGYYWLAGDWPNLLISCPDCNRSRTHKVPGQSEGALLGKGTQFPLDFEDSRVRHHDDQIAVEDTARLLLDPCVDNPEEHLEFDETGNIRARIRNGVESSRGKWSIDVFALRRKTLVEKRLKVLLDLQFLINSLTHHVLMSNRMQDTGAAADIVQLNTRQLAEVMGQLASMFAPSSEYLAAKSDWIHAADENGDFEVIRAFGVEPIQLLTAN